MNHYIKIQELFQIQIKKGELQSELCAFLKQHTERIRKYTNGEKVETFNDTGRSMGVGIINFAFLSAGVEPFEVARYAKDSSKWEKEINEVVYRVHKIRKDGSMSSHQLATCHEHPGHFQNYLKPYNP